MSNFEKITASPEKPGVFLELLTVIDSPWEDGFHKTICADCDQTVYVACPREKERNNPLWWLMLEATERKKPK